MWETDDVERPDSAHLLRNDVFRKRRPVWHRDPKIKPNYGQKKPLLPKSQVKKVVLYSNQNEDRKLRQEMGHIRLEEKWATQLHSLQRKSFAIRQILQEQHLESKGIKLINILPSNLKAEFKHHAMFHNMTKYGAKDLPMWHRLDKQGLKTTQDKFTQVELQKEVAKKEKEERHRRSLAAAMLARNVPPRVSSASSDNSFTTDSSEQSQKLPPIQSPGETISVTGVPLKSRPYSTYNVRERKEHTVVSDLPIHREKSVVDPRFIKLSKSLSNLGPSPRGYDPFLLLSESSWGHMTKLNKADTDHIHEKYMPPVCTKKKVGSNAKQLFPKALHLIKNHKGGEGADNLK